MNLDEDRGKERPPRGEGFPQILHDRSRDVGRELQRLIVSLATGTLAIYFLALTSEAKPALSRNQKAVAIAALTVMVLCVASGVLGMYADARRNYFWASALQAADNKTKSTLYKQRDRWLLVERTMDITLSATFLIGMLTSVGYMVLRVLSR